MKSERKTERVQIVVIGGGQSGLSVGYCLQRAGLSFVILEANAQVGDSWRRRWDSLRLFSPAAYSSLPGWFMPPQVGEEYPDAAHVVAYLRDYEKRYELPVHRPVRVLGVHRDGELLRVQTDSGAWHAGRPAGSVQPTRITTLTQAGLAGRCTTPR